MYVESTIFLLIKYSTLSSEVKSSPTLFSDASAPPVSHVVTTYSFAFDLMEISVSDNVSGYFRTRCSIFD